MDMMKVTINKKDAEVEAGRTVEEHLAETGNTKAAVWINGVQLLRAEYVTRVMMPGDDISIRRIVAGG